MVRRRGSGEGAGRSPEVVAAEERERERGREAAAAGRPRTDNPFPDFTAIARAWWEGFDGHRPEVAPPPPPPPPLPPPVSTPAEPPVSTPAEAPVSTPSTRPTVRVPGKLAPYPRCPSCRTEGGRVCANSCSHRQQRERVERIARRREAEEAPGEELPPPPPPEAHPEELPPPVEEAPGGRVLPFRVLPGGEAAPDPHEEHRRFLVELLEETLALVRAGHVDAGFFVVHHSPTHPTGAGWATAFTGNVDFVHRLGALELAKADLLAKANASPKG